MLQFSAWSGEFISAAVPAFVNHIYPLSTLMSAVVNADFHVEELEYRAEADDSSQAWVPLRIIKPKHAKGPLPTVVYLHATGLH